ncbi:MAG TPA: hypothetical protein VL361_04230 [Candidatus Limnocylindrales bacterium]|jgi:hypothetical protein|nr:hypothetical protein [Candidatus Limnocylindrales bacterium]
MYQSRVDQSANLLQVSFSGRVDAQEMERCAKECEVAVRQVRPGFRLLTDITDLEQMDLACEPHLQRMMDLSNEAGVALVVRVIPRPHRDIGFNIMSLFHYRKNVRIVTCRTLKQAEEILASEV